MRQGHIRLELEDNYYAIPRPWTHAIREAHRNLFKTSESMLIHTWSEIRFNVSRGRLLTLYFCLDKREDHLNRIEIRASPGPARQHQAAGSQEPSRSHRGAGTGDVRQKCSFVLSAPIAHRFAHFGFIEGSTLFGRANFI
jgi:hypothetical protein